VKSRIPGLPIRRPEGDSELMAAYLLTSIALMLVTGCATALPDTLLQPRPVTTEIPSLAWPTVELSIVDERYNANLAHEPLVYAVESTLRRALSVSAASEPAEYRLTVTIVRHDVGFAAPWWTGATELRAQLARGGETVADWRVVDTSQEWNLRGYSSGTEAAQDSLTDGLRKLLRRMAAEIQFGQVLPGSSGGSSGTVIIRTPTAEPPAPAPAQTAPTPASTLLCRQRANNVRGAGSWREAWLAEYQRCMAGH
jgi:hypothetical protein